MVPVQLEWNLWDPVGEESIFGACRVYVVDAPVVSGNFFC